MKKKVLSLLVVAVLLISVLAVTAITASAEHLREQTPMVDGVAQPIYHCTCGYAHYSAEGDTEVAWYNPNYTGHVGDCGGTNLKWIPTATLPTDGSSRYYLTGDVAVTEVTKVTLGQTCRLDLNGYTVSSETAQIYTLATDSNSKATNTALLLTDSWGGGTMEITGTFERRGGILGGVTSGKIYIYRGTYDASKSTNNTQSYGASVINASGTVYMYGGTMKGGTVKSGGAVTVGGAFYMYTGSIEGGTASNGGGSILIPSGTAYIYGGTITGGRATSDGGNIRIWDSGKLYVGGYEGSMVCEDKAIITLGQAKNGGNIMADKNATIQIKSGAEITSGTATAGGGNIAVIESGGKAVTSFTISGGTISGGTAIRGGNIYFNTDGTLKITGGTISGGNAINGTSSYDYYNCGGNIAVTDYSSSSYAASKTTYPKVNITGGTIKNGNAGRNGGNLYLYNLMTADTASVLGGTIYGGSATTGGSVYLYKAANVTISGSVGGSTTDKPGGTANNGGNLYITTVDSVTLSGSVTGGTASEDGGNIYMYSVDSAILSGSVTGGTATSNAGNVFMDGVTEMTLSGTVTGGTAYAGGSVYLVGETTVNMTGTISDGTAVGTQTATNANAGNVFIGSEATLNMTGAASITGGHASNTAGNVQSWGILSLADTASISGGITGTNTTVGGTANVQLAGANAELQMSGTASIPGGVQTYNNPSIVLTGTPTLGSLTDGLTIAHTTTEAVVNAAGMTGGQLVVQVNTDTGVEKTRNFATIANEGQLAYILSEDDEYKVMADGTSAHLTKKLVVIEGANGYSQDYVTLAAAVAAAAEGDKIVLLSNATTDNAEINKTIVLDLNGKTLTGNITGTGTLKGMDSANDDYVGTGKIWGTIDEKITVEPSYNFTSDTGVVRTYLALTGTKVINEVETPETSFHRVYLKITSTMLRPNYKLNGEYAPGIYYKVTIAGDEAVLDAIGTYGVAAGKTTAPTELETGKFSAFEVAADAQPATAITANGTMIAGIMKESNETATNVDNASTKVYGVPYITLKSGETIMGVANETTLQTALSAAYKLWNDGGLTHADQITAMTQLDTAFADEIAALQLSAPEATPAE